MYKERSGWKTKSNFRKGNFKKKSFISKNISSSEASSNENSEEKVGEALLMAFEEENLKIKQKLEEEIDEEEVKAEVNLEEELIAALEELEIERKKYRKTSRKLDDANEIIISLKVQVEEMQKTTEDLEE